jgi:hypothetical protein
LPTNINNYLSHSTDNIIIIIFHQWKPTVLTLTATAVIPIPAEAVGVAEEEVVQVAGEVGAIMAGEGVLVGVEKMARC